MNPLSLFFVLMVGHAVADYPLQGDFLARGKNHTLPIPGVPWWQCLGAHALIHGGAVALATGMPALGVAEALAHAVIDHLKCAGRLSFNQDQAAHVACKVLWVAIVLYTGGR